MLDEKEIEIEDNEMEQITIATLHSSRKQIQNILIGY